MYDQIYVLEMLNKQKQDELKEIYYPITKIKSKQTGLCRLPVINKLPACQCH